jgi:zinc protease
MTDLPAGTKPESLPPVPDLNQSRTIKIDFPSKQSHIYVGQPGMKRNDEDFFSLFVANHPFGGSGFASRLVEVIREQRGLAYSVSSYFSPMRQRGPFLMSLQTRADQTDEALSLLRSELEKYVAEGPEQEELEASISNITGSFPLGLDSNSKLLGFLAMIGFYGLPHDYLDTYLDNIRKVDGDDVRDVLKRRIDVDKMVTVIVGNGN